MKRAVQIRVHPADLYDETSLKRLAAKQARISPQSIAGYVVRRRSIDARKKRPVFVLHLDLWIGEHPGVADRPPFPLRNVEDSRSIYIIGLGPAGLFAALTCIEQGYKPIVIERGKDVRARRRDLARLTKEGIVHPDSNYCFGEGGAGTFSDGKLYTRSTKRGDTRRVLDILTQFGATPDIRVDAHPHIGTNKLPKIIQAMREAIVTSGGEVHFDTRMTDLRLSQEGLTHIQLNGDLWVPVEALILATGHSARDIFSLLHQRNILIEAKPFALGVRVEHPQALIDEIQYHCEGPRHPNLPAASYALVQQVEEKGVYSFCMCPGGIICPAATGNDEVVVNGWSPSKRNSPYANSGMVVEIALTDLEQALENPLAGIAFQHGIEQKAFQHGGGRQVAPAARLSDFVRGKISTSLPNCSYIPGLQAVDMGAVLPRFVHRRLQKGFQAFDRKMQGYLTNEAVVVGVESRTSSPVRIPRDRETYMHPQVQGLFPCGEGAGYAGGIMSAAIDGQRCAGAAIRHIRDRQQL